MEDDISEKIKSSASCSTSSLTEIERGQEDAVTTEDHGRTRHVDTQSQRSSGYNNTQKSCAE
jgi:hypothetical protein